jgi:hypothetical protein
MPVIVYASAYNDIYVPVTVYETLEQAAEHLTAILGFEPTDAGDKLIWYLIGANPIKKEMETLFSYYYDGCGECGGIIAKEIEFGQLKILPFDLD